MSSVNSILLRGTVQSMGGNGYRGGTGGVLSVSSSSSWVDYSGVLSSQGVMVIMRVIRRVRGVTSVSVVLED